MIPTQYYIVLSAILFGLGVFAFIFKRNIISIFMSIELMLNAVNLAFVAFSQAKGQLDGQIFVLFVIVVAAAEAAVGLGIIILIARNRQSLNVERVDLLLDVVARRVVEREIGELGPQRETLRRIVAREREREIRFLPLQVVGARAIGARSAVGERRVERTDGATILRDHRRAVRVEILLRRLEDRSLLRSGLTRDATRDVGTSRRRPSGGTADRRSGSSLAREVRKRKCPRNFSLSRPCSLCPLQRCSSFSPSGSWPPFAS